MRGFRDLPPDVQSWGQQHNIPTSILQMVVAIPLNKTAEFYLKNDGVLANKNYIPANKEAKLIEWLKLTHELFFVL